MLTEDEAKRIAARFIEVVMTEAEKFEAKGVSRADIYIALGRFNDALTISLSRLVERSLLRQLHDTFGIKP